MAAGDPMTKRKSESQRRLTRDERRRLALIGIDPARVVDAVCARLVVPVDEVLSGARHDRAVLARHLAAWLLRWRLGFSLSQIGRLLHIDHTSALYGIRRIEHDIETDDGGDYGIDQVICEIWQNVVGSS